MKNFENRNPLLVGGQRNAHGTRISRRIVCSECSALDYITVRPKEGGMLCRECARKNFAAYEVGVFVPRAKQEVFCGQCSVGFLLPVEVERHAGLLCPDCKKGFEIWRGSRDSDPESREAKVLLKTKSGLILRRSK